VIHGIAKRIEKTPREKIEENWKKHHQTLHELQLYIAELKADAQQRLADNPEQLEVTEDRINSFYEDQFRRHESGQL